MTTNAAPFAALDGAQFLVLTTYRQSGEAVPTVVWFAARDGKLYITTSGAAGKLRRIRDNPQVSVAPSDGAGVVTSATCAALAHEATGDEHAIAEEALNAKYGAQRRATWTASPFLATATHLVLTPAE